jgi:large subunit ribosomal protein L18
VDHQKAKHQQQTRRAFRVRKKFTGTAERPRLSVRRSLKHIYCQVIDDQQGRTLAAASSIDKELRGQLGYGGNSDAAAAVGRVIAERVKAAGIQALTIDRGARRYHGRIAALTNALRESGIQV